MTMKRMLPSAVPLLVASAVLLTSTAAFSQATAPQPSTPQSSAAQSSTAPKSTTPSQSAPQASTPQSAPSATTSSKPEPPPNPNPPSREEVLKLMDAMHAREQMQQLIDQLAGQLKQGAKQALTRQVPNATPEMTKKIDDMFADFPKYVNTDEAIGDAVTVYQKYLTKEDIAGAVAFYQSPAGQHLVEKMPQLQQESMRAGSERIQGHVREFVTAVQKQIDTFAAEAKKNEKPATGSTGKSTSGTSGTKSSGTSSTTSGAKSSTTPTKSGTSTTPKTTTPAPK